MNDSEVIEGEVMAQSTTALALTPERALLPVVSAPEAKAAMTRYLEICEAVLTPDDYQEFPQWDQVAKKRVMKRFKKKSAVKKLQTFWGVSVETPDAIRDDLGDGHFAFRVRAKATAKDGRPIEAWGACSTFEERFDLTPKDNESEAEFAIRQRKALARAYHDVLATAETRATNRAVMNAIGVGGGEVTADEMGAGGRDEDVLPPCPSCGKGNTVIRGKEEYGGGFVCWKKKGGCGNQFFAAPDIPQGAQSTPPPTPQPAPQQPEAEPQKIPIDVRARFMEFTTKLPPDEVKAIIQTVQEHYGHEKTGRVPDLFEGDEARDAYKRLKAKAAEFAK